MARPFSSMDSKWLVKEHKTLKRKLIEVRGYAEYYLDEISRASEELITQEVFSVLETIPIDEINRYKKGFRIKALRDYGFNTIADISNASVHRIASINGIGQDTASYIKRIVADIKSKARKGIKIKLSTDCMNPVATRLIDAIHNYKISLPIAEKCKGILAANSYEINYAIENLLPATSGIKWFFTSAVNKQKAIEAYSKLNSMLINEYGQELEGIFLVFDTIKHSTNTKAWQSFTEQPIQFFNILEEVKPGILGTDDTTYGLPEDLAREIQDECFFPDGLLCQLRPYQEWGVKYILHQEQVLLGDEMGLGKTIQAIATMVSLRNTGATHFVVVCPASVIVNWCREISQKSRLSVIKIHGTGRNDALRSWTKDGGVAVTTYETTGYLKIEKNFNFSLLVVDEAHYIKNPEARRTMNVKQLKSHAQRTLFMTGTALENKVDEMIYLIYMLQPQIALKVRGIVFMSAAPQFREKVAPVYYRRKREEVQKELPDLIESKEWCTLHREEEQLYERAVLGKHYADARRVSWNVDNLHNSSKAMRLLEIIEEAEAESRKVIVFSFFLDTIQKVVNLLGERCLCPINGSVPPQRRQEIIDEFGKAVAGTVLVAQIQSGGTGLNIQSASVVVICEPQFKPSIENQAISRAYRMGQTRNVLVYRLLCENTVDEKIISILESKQAIFDAFADKSVAAEKSIELDDKSFGDIIKEEIKRINEKRDRIILEDEEDTIGNS